MRLKETYRWETVPIVIEITEGQEKFIGGFHRPQRILTQRKTTPSRVI